VVLKVERIRGGEKVLDSLSENSEASRVLNVIFKGEDLRPLSDPDRAPQDLNRDTSIIHLY
jgi:hypothetical protein